MAKAKKTRTRRMAGHDEAMARLERRLAAVLDELRSLGAHRATAWRNERVRTLQDEYAAIGEEMRTLFA